MASVKPATNGWKRRPGVSADEKAAYLALFRAYPIRPLRSETDLDEALAVARDLLCRRKPLNRDEQDYFDILAHEIARYEAIACPMPTVSGADMVRHLIDAHGVTLAEVAQGSKISVSTLSSISQGKRRLNLSHIRKLASFFGVEPGVFLE